MRQRLSLNWAILALRQSAPAEGLSWAGAIGAFERCERQTRRPHQGRQQHGSPAADRGRLVLPFPGPGQPRVAASAGGAAQADPRSPGRRSCGCARAIASSLAAASRPMSSPPRSPVSWRASSGPSPGACRWRQAEHNKPVIASQGGASKPPDMPHRARLGARSRPGEPSHPLSAGSPIRRRSLDRGSPATHQRSCGFDPRIRV